MALLHFKYTLIHGATGLDKSTALFWVSAPKRNEAGTGADLTVWTALYNCRVQLFDDTWSESYGGADSFCPWPHLEMGIPT